MPMPSVAEQLRQARQEQGLTVDQVADVTKIRTDHIRALEGGNYDVFPAPVYVRGFVRTYADTLKLDAAQVVRDLESELGQSRKFQDPPPLTGKRSGVLDEVMLQLSKVNWRAGVWIGGIVLALVLVWAAVRIWQHYATYDPLANVGPGLYKEPATNRGEMLPPPPLNP